MSAIGEGTFSSDFVDEWEALMKAADVEVLMENILEAMKDTREGVQRISKIVHSMRVFSHP